MTARRLIVGLLVMLLGISGAAAWDRPAPARSAAHAELDQQMRRQRVLMADMQRHLDALQATTDPARRAALLEAHFQGMRDTLRLMQRMAELSMRGHGDDGGRPSGGYGSTPNAEEVHRYAMLKERLDMLQALLEQMVLREAFIGSWATDPDGRDTPPE